MRRFAIWIRLIAVVGFIVPLTATSVLANSAECRDLEARLASVSHGGDRTKLRRYERAIISQRQQLERARNRQANNGCSSFLSSIKPQCGEIRATVAKMERNLLDLERTKNRLAGGDASQEKARIRSEIARKGCGAVKEASGERRTGLFARLFGTRGQDANRNEPAPDEKEQSRPSRSSGLGNYRTLCVRTCDGYFFPIAYASSPQNFDRDTKACMAMCPGTEVELYYHRVPDEETDAMVSAVSGEPYTNMSTAFRYRDPDYQRPKACGCNTPKEFSIVAGEVPVENAAEEVREEAVFLPEPQWRPDPAEDPETRANRESGLTASAVARLLAPEISTREKMPTQIGEADEEKRVRVVGPAFLPDPEAAIDLRAPGRTELR